MAKTSGSVRKRGGFTTRDSNYKGKVGELKGLVTVSDPTVYKQLKESISRYHAVMGVRQREIKIAELSAGTNGVHVTADGQSSLIVLNEKVFNKTKSEIEARVKRAYDSGWSTKTNKPVGHTVTHELAHATWNSHMTGAKQKAAGIEIQKVYRQWSADKTKKGYGEYASTNINEFWAETSTKAVHGKADKYTKRVKNIIRKYKL